jgi:UDPglucose 6-dehydrogenase/GDP-mannose 6-dehydrogenase
MRVSIVGTGYVGLVSAAGLAEVGHEVTCVDVDPQKVHLINRGIAPIFEAGLDALVKRHAGGRLSATCDLEAAVLGSEVTLIAVGTPFDGEHIDLAQIRRAARQIGDALGRKSGYHVVAVKSTVVPGTTTGVVLPILEERSARTAGADFGVGMTPEFLREGNAVADFLAPDRIVLGGIDARTQDVLGELYAPFAADTIRTNPTTAEMIKYTANSLLASLISFSNEIANLCSAVGVDVAEVQRGVHLDRRFSPIQADGQRIRPISLSYLEAGCGFGGSCLPKDVKALIAFGRDVGSPMRVLESVIGVNQGQPAQMLRLLRKHLPDLQGLNVAVLGMAFKPATDDIRESPALAVTQSLLDAGAVVKAFDPIARRAAEQVFGGRVEFVDSLESSLENVSAVLIMTRWPQFERLPELIAALPRPPLVVDGRRMLAKDSVPRYEGIGL